MRTKRIISQDRDRIYALDKQTYLSPLPVIHDGICIGYNLLIGVSLGTFDSLKETVGEIHNILNIDTEIYAVSGFSEGGHDDELDY